MSAISPQGLLAQLTSFVALAAAPAEEQDQWSKQTSFPAEEIALQIFDSVPHWFGRLREAGLIDSSDERAVARLSDYLHTEILKLFHNGCVTGAPEWQHARELASTALKSLQRPPRAKS